MIRSKHSPVFCTECGDAKLPVFTDGDLGTFHFCPSCEPTEADNETE